MRKDEQQFKLLFQITCCYKQNYLLHKSIIKQIIQMQAIISQIPELIPFLSPLPKQQHPDAIKHLIRLGLEVSRSYCCQENQLNSSNILKKQIDILKENFQVLNQMVKQQCHHHCHYCLPSQPTNSPNQFFQTQPTLNDQNTFGKNVNNNVKPTKDIKPEQKIPEQPSKRGKKTNKETQTLNPFLKQKTYVSRHHLDDREVRQALEFPPQTLLQTQTRIKRSSKEYRKHIYQDQINKEELVRIKQEKGESLDRSRRDRTVSDYTKTTSKIKPLIDKDRIRFMQRKQEYEFNEGFNKYEYSDESQMEESSLRENQADHQKYQKYVEENSYNPHLQSNIQGSHQSSSQKSRNKTSSKKQFSRSRNQGMGQPDAVLIQEYLQDKSRSGSKGQPVLYQHQEMSRERPNNIEYEDMQDDVVSNSSSFSQFSINGSRRKEVGKISRRSEKD